MKTKYLKFYKVVLNQEIETFRFAINQLELVTGLLNLFGSEVTSIHIKEVK